MPRLACDEDLYNLLKTVSDISLIPFAKVLSTYLGKSYISHGSSIAYYWEVPAVYVMFHFYLGNDTPATRRALPNPTCACDVSVYLCN